MRTTRTGLAAAAAGAVALSALSLSLPATAAGDDEPKLTAGAGGHCRDDGSTRVRVWVKNTSRKHTSTVSYSLRRAGEDERLYTTWVDAPDAKRLIRFTISADSSARVTVGPGTAFDGSLLDEKIRALDC